MEGTARSGSDFDIVSFVRGVRAEWESGNVARQLRENLSRHVDGLQRRLPQFPLPIIARQARADPAASAKGAERPPGLKDVGLRATGGARSGGAQGGGAEGNDSRGDEDGAETRRNSAGAPTGAVAQAGQAQSSKARGGSGRKWGRETVKQRMERWRREREMMMMRAAEEERRREAEAEAEGEGEGARETVEVEELYVARSRHYTPNVLTFGYSFKEWTEYWALLSTGELYLGLPHGDPRHFDFHHDRRTNPHRYVPLSHSHGAAHEFEYGGCQVALAPGQQEVRVGGGDVVFKRVQPCEAEEGCRLEGRFVHAAARDFVDAAEASGVHGGTTLRYEGGRVEDAFFFEYPGSGGSEVNINGTTYQRVVEQGGEE
ncbi:unnamed protein product [Closterium sp. Yama58-4]|nr:unnamed protein product [Closterium sp. Yama58-4]